MIMNYKTTVDFCVFLAHHKSLCCICFVCKPSPSQVFLSQVYVIAAYLFTAQNRGRKNGFVILSCFLASLDFLF